MLIFEVFQKSRYVDELRLLLSTRLRSFLPDDAVEQSFEEHEGHVLKLPEDAIPPDAGFLEKHRKRYQFR